MTTTEQKITGTRIEVNFTEKNKKGERMMMYITKCECGDYQNALPRLWHKHGYIDRILPTYWHLETFVYDKKDNCYGRYNPQIIFKNRPILNFDWMLEATEENKEKLIQEVLRRFNS